MTLFIMDIVLEPNKIEPIPQIPGDIGKIISLQWVCGNTFQEDFRGPAHIILQISEKVQLSEYSDIGHLGDLNHSYMFGQSFICSSKYCYMRVCVEGFGL